ncbi:MAG: DUF1266 domain-containing protein [Defluviitaleaceae bacterium]|nr:DUF1266 domain-containing protein [Defluviitaleaceae bacterium]
MKKIITTVLLAITFLGTITATANERNIEPMQVTETIFFHIDGDFIHPPRPSILSLNDTLFMRANDLLTNLGAFYGNNPRAFTLDDDHDNFVLAYKNIRFVAGQAVVYINDEPITLQSETFIHDGALYIPIIEIAELLGQSVRINVFEEAGMSHISIRPHNRFGDDLPAFLTALNNNGLIRSLWTFDFDLVGGYERRTAGSRNRRLTLSTGWNVNDRESALRVINNLYTSGHNAQYNEHHLANNTTSPWGEAGILGWDLARVSQVAGLSYIVGYITYEEFIYFTLRAALVLQEHFESWDEFGQNFVYGSSFWLRNRTQRERDSEVRRREVAHRTFMTEYVDYMPEWNMDLSYYMELFIIEEESSN